MSVLSDSEIRKLCQGDKPMLVPFSEGVSIDGQISWGLSSIGYDIRISGKVWVMKNSYGLTVDPKKFKDPVYAKMIFDEIEYPPHEAIAIPAGGYILAESLEWFNMPMIAGRCTGKSTLARCFTGDTRVALVDGSSPTFEELCDRFNQGEKEFYGYGYSQGQFVSQPMTNPRMVGVEKTIAVELDNGDCVHATPDHKFLLRSGEKKRADRLGKGDSLLPLYRHDSHGYESVYNPLSRAWRVTHLLVKDMLVCRGKEIPEGATHTHHVDNNRRNNLPSNLTFITPTEHALIHNEDKDLSAMASLYWNDPLREEERAEHLSKLHLEESRRKAGESLKEWYNKEGVIEKVRVIRKQAWKNSSVERVENQREIARRMKIREDITEDRVKEALKQTGTIRGAARLLAVDRTAFRRFPELMDSFKQGELFNNHKVVRTTKTKGTRPVYCLTAPKTGNFALESGVMVNNCGITINVTPLEPMWEGKLVIEIANDGPNTGFVYSHEGIAQIQFEQIFGVVEKHYANKNNGKPSRYQNQTGITLARV